MITARGFVILCTALFIAQKPYIFAQQAPPAGATSGQSQAALTPQQLDSLVAPIALYPDPILSQALVASTYPLEIVEAGRWLGQNPNLKGQALADAAKKQNWDASVQALVMLPDVLQRLDQDVSWTSELGNAFLSQEQGVMDAIQRMRQKASANGALQSTPQQTVSTTAENGQNYIVIEPTTPEVVYVPQYNPVAVWGPPPDYYPYPPIYYPSAGAVAASAISFGAGIAVGAIWGGGWNSWGWNCGWGSHNVVINNNFINNNRFNRVNVANGNAWIHNPAHRRDVPYNNRGLSNRFQGGANNFTRPTVGQTEQRLNQLPGARGGAGNQIGQGNFNRPGGAGSGAANRMGQGNFNRGGAAAMPSTGGANRMAPQNFGDRIGNRNIGAGAGGGAFGGMNLGGDRMRMNSNRGFSSFGGGGGFRGGGGGFRGGGGGFRGGGRRR